MPANRSKTGKRKANRTSFKPGRSGNPAGRPPLTPEEREVRELARQMSPDALRRLERIGKVSRGSPGVRANEAILDRAFGKPHQEIEHSGAVKTGGIDLSKCTDEELTFLAAISARLAAGSGGDSSGAEPPRG